MPLAILRTAVFSLVLLAIAAARADDLADFNAAVEAAAAQNRIAIGYLRAENIDLAGIALDRLRAAWAEVAKRARPAAFAGNPLYTSAMTDIATRLATADMMLSSGRADAARTALIGVRDDLYELRKSAHVPVLADCVRDANAAFETLARYDDPQQTASAEFATGATRAAQAYGTALTRCDRMADERTRTAPEFRRLIDDAQASLALVRQAVTSKDFELLHRLIGELRSLDNLLAFRFG